MLRNNVSSQDRVYWTTDSNSYYENWYYDLPECRILQDIQKDNKYNDATINIYGVLTKEGLFRYVEQHTAMRYRNT